MVATKMIPNKRRGGFNGMPPRQRFKPGGGPKHINNRHMGAMFNANQLGDNPGFMDFNDDVQIPPIPAPTPAQSTGSTSAAESSTSTANTSTPSSTAVVATGNKGAKGPTNRKPNPNQKRPVKNGGMRRMPPGINGHWGPPVPPMPPMFPMGGGRRGGPIPPPPPHYRVPPMGMRGMRGGPMMPPPPPNGRFAGPPIGPGPMTLMQRPIPPIPPMRGPMLNPMGRMMPPPLRNRPDIAPMRRLPPNGKLPPGRLGKAGKAPNRNAIANGKGMKPLNKRIKPKAPAKPREEYPLDKPWVTEEIKQEHDKKVELADRLKGNKDDALFAQFKEQRDKFVKMYDAARLEFIGKHPEQDVEKILTESVASQITKPESQKPNDAVSTDTPAATATTATTATTTSTTGTTAAADSSASSA